MSRTSSGQGITLAMVAVACFAAYDTSTKVVSAGVPLVVALWVRYALQVALVSKSFRLSGQGHKWATERRGMHLCRALALLGNNVFSFLSFMFLPVAEVTAILMLTPILMTVFASVFLHERIRPVQWCLIGLGFLGALFIVKPGQAHTDWHLLLPCGLLVCNTVFQALTSKLVKTEPAEKVFLYTSTVGWLALSALLPFAWTGVPNVTYCLVLLLMAVFSTLGHHLLVLAYGRAPASSVSPFLYFQLIFAALGGWLVFKQVPDAWSMLGIAMIAGSGASGAILKSVGREPARQGLHSNSMTSSPSPATQPSATIDQPR